MMSESHTGDESLFRKCSSHPPLHFWFTQFSCGVCLISWRPDCCNRIVFLVHSSLGRKETQRIRSFCDPSPNSSFSFPSL